MLLDHEKQREILSQNFMPVINEYISNNSRHRNGVLVKEFSLYNESNILLEYRELVVKIHHAVSILTLRYSNNSQYINNCPRYHRNMSEHETLISNLLSANHGIIPVRQLLIGKTHADFYIPELHLSIEPSSERYFASARRVKMEEEAEYLRSRMNRLATWRVEKYSDTRQALARTLSALSLERKVISPHAILDNNFTIAINTLPIFIPYKVLLQALNH